MKQFDGKMYKSNLFVAIKQKVEVKILSVMSIRLYHVFRHLKTRTIQKINKSKIHGQINIYFEQAHVK